MEAKLSPEMLKALEFANKHGGKLVRYPGGFWMEEGHTSKNYVYGHEPVQTFGTSTVEAIVRRGAGKYTAWKDGRGSKFPVEMTVIGTPTPTPGA